MALGALMGRRSAQRLALRAEALEAMPADLARLTKAMLEDRLPLAEALAQCRTQALRTGASPLFTREENALLSEVSPARLSQGKDPALRLQEVCAAFTRLSAQARQRQEASARLYPSVGALAGLMAALCLL